MKFKVVKRCQEDLHSIHGLLKSFLPFARKRMGFNKPPTIFFQSDQGNAQKLLGKTAHYEPSTMNITVYVTGRHPKDVLRSLSHELVHHGQNCSGEFGHTPDTAPGYAQRSKHLRNMEIEAYREGNLCFRDWEDEVKSGKINIPMELRESLFNNLGENKMKLNEWKRNELNRLLMEKFDLKEKHCGNRDEEDLEEGQESTEKYDDDPALTGDQDELPDELQKGIIQAKEGLDSVEALEEGHDCADHPGQSHQQWLEEHSK